MKNRIFFIAVVIFAFAMNSCQKEEKIDVSKNHDLMSTPARVQSAADLKGTSWTYYIENWVIRNAKGDSTGFVSLKMRFNLAFDNSYAHLDLPSKMEKFTLFDGLTGKQLEDIKYIFDYTYSTHTGHIIGEGTNANGKKVEVNMPFTYNDATDAITFLLSFGTMFSNFPVVFTRVEK